MCAFDLSGDRDGALGIAFVCTANRARSPFAAALLRRHLVHLPVDVESFGTLDQEGAPALPRAVAAANSFGVDLSGHRARVLRPGALEHMHLAVGFEASHVAAAVVVGGIAPERVFLLGELADVLAFDVLPWPQGADDPVSRVAHTNARRFAGGRLAREVSDPVGGTDNVFRRTYEQIDRAVVIISMRLFGAIGAD